MNFQLDETRRDQSQWSNTKIVWPLNKTLASARYSASCLVEYGCDQKRTIGLGLGPGNHLGMVHVSG